jgi:predicted homoserine dehydrogenase-like protein
VSVRAAGLSGVATGVPRSNEADVVATAKRDLHPGETLDGEGGETVYGRLAPTNESVAQAALPIGLARGLRITRAVPEGGAVRYDDAEPPASAALEARRELELRLTRPAPRAGSRPPTR